MPDYRLSAGQLERLQEAVADLSADAQEVQAQAHGLSDQLAIYRRSLARFSTLLDEVQAQPIGGDGGGESSR